jgi:FtsP/CotA-like multicopper oxidase with cupredoxin domain
MGRAMQMTLSRRDLLSSGAAVFATSALPVRRAFADISTPLIVERRQLDIDGKPASVFGIQQSDGTPGLVLDPGQRFRVELRNRGGVPTIAHWHGQTPPVAQDGVTDTGLETLVADGGTQAYDFAPRPGTHWMHSHHGLQAQSLMAAPLIVRRPEDLRADAQEVVVLLQDFSFRDPAEILASLQHRSMPNGMMHDMQGMKMPMTMTMPMHGERGRRHHETAHHPMPPHAMHGASTPQMDLNDVDFDAYLANGRTLSDPLVVRTERGASVRLRLINGAAATAFWIDLGGLDGQVVAVDGDPVAPLTVRRFPIAEAQRVDILLRLPQTGAFPVRAQREGDRQRTGIILATTGAPVPKIAALADRAAAPADLSFEQRLRAAAPLAPREPDRIRRLQLTGSMMPYVWGFDGRGWTERQPVIVQRGERVALDLVNDTGMAHPMHLHGHHFQVLAVNGVAFPGALRDTVLVPAKGSVRIAFDADNPGRWLFHCHNIYHMASGMMTEVAYAGFVAGH